MAKRLLNPILYEISHTSSVRPIRVLVQAMYRRDNQLQQIEQNEVRLREELDALVSTLTLDDKCRNALLAAPDGGAGSSALQHVDALSRAAAALDRCLSMAFQPQLVKMRGALARIAFAFPHLSTINAMRALMQCALRCRAFSDYVRSEFTCAIGARHLFRLLQLPESDCVLSVHCSRHQSHH